jgi:ribose 5-phosphate isomerase B
MKDLYIASDHAGFELKRTIIDYLQSHFASLKLNDLGTDNAEISVDYPDYGFAVAQKITQNDGVGILICGSGVGISIAANRIKGARAALCFTTEMAILTRSHNDANILVLGARIIPQEIAINCVDAFLKTPFDGGRHAARIEKLG